MKSLLKHQLCSIRGFDVKILSKYLVFAFVILSSINTLAHSKNISNKNPTRIKLKNIDLIFDLEGGTVSYQYDNGLTLMNTTAYVDLLGDQRIESNSFRFHKIRKSKISDKMGKGSKISFIHYGNFGITMIQEFTQYEGKSNILLKLVVRGENGTVLETRNISPLLVSKELGGSAVLKSKIPKIVDLPFDNDNWLKLLAQYWPKTERESIEGISHEMLMLYDEDNYNGWVIGSLEHDFWKTGFVYKTLGTKGELDKFIAYSGAARPDNSSLPANHGGQDGTHDVMPHGTMRGNEVSSALLFMEAGKDFRKLCVNFGTEQSALVGKLEWNGAAPVYWNSFGVEGVLGFEGIMMPAGVKQIVDFVQSLDNLNRNSKPILSIDSYDQGIYTTEVLGNIGDYARSKGQEIGFYCSPFSLWTWSNNIDNAKLPGTDVPLRDVILRDDKDRPIPFKDGEWGAYPLDPTHPATRLSMINQIEKAKRIGAKLLKIDFLTAGSLEAVKWYDPKIRSGMQAYDYGMKLFKHLVDSVMGKDIFITMAISPMFPHQYAHTRFISTDVHSHLRDSQPGFPHYGSTASSMITASHMGWVQGTLWPYTNMDVLVMKKFQKHPELQENEVKARLISLITMGSILGDGSDYRDASTALRARYFLNNANVDRYFQNPKAFIPLKLSQGESMDQQLSFYLPTENGALYSAFNFDETKSFEIKITTKDLGLISQKYVIKDFFTGDVLGQLEKGDGAIFSDMVKAKSATLFEIQQIN